MRVNATNHAGWAVEFLTEEGWENVSLSKYTYETREMAEEFMNNTKSFAAKAGYELRVYEALNVPTN